jgi:hypothetical protein
MSRKKQVYTILTGIIACLLLNIIISLLIYKRNSNNNANTQMQTDFKTIKLQSLMQAQLEVENKSLIVNNVISDSLMNYIGNDTILILYLDQYSCGICIDNAIADLLSYKDSIDPKNVLIIFSAENNRDVILLRNKIKNSFNILPIKERDMNFEGISKNMPIHFFVIDRNLEPFCIYFYAPEFSELNKKYLNIVHQRFLKMKSCKKYLG